MLSNSRHILAGKTYRVVRNNRAIKRALSVHVPPRFLRHAGFSQTQSRVNRASLVHRAVAAREDVRDDGVFSIFASSVDVRVVGFALHFVTYFRAFERFTRSERVPTMMLSVFISI